MRRLPAGRRWVRGVRRGLVAGTAGTAAEMVATTVEDRLRGGPAVFDPGVMAGRLAHSWLHRRFSAEQKRLLGTAMRWAYGPGWGVLFGVGRPALRRRAPDLAWPLLGLALGGAVFGFELMALPLSRATPALNAWGRRQVLQDALNTAVYGLVVALAYHLLSNEEVQR